MPQDFPAEPWELIRFNPFEAGHRFDYTRCILTGLPIDPTKDLRPVFPGTWFERVGLRPGHRLQLVDGSSLDYRELRLPLHPACWEGGVDEVARKCAELFASGIETLGWTRTERIYQWMCWLFIGVLYAEMNALSDKEDAHPAWRESSFLNRYRMIHLSLQGAVFPLQYLGYDPGSVFILPLDGDKKGFDFKSSSNTQSLSLRVGESLILASLGDNGAHMAFFEDEFLSYRHQTLRPLQGDEIFARMCYRNHLLNPVFEYGIGFGDEEDATTYIRMQIPPELAGEEAFGPWSDMEYATVLDQYLRPHGVEPLKTFQESGELMTFLEPRNGS
jgi:hypothetical protein